ncbi:hypothetical protein G4B88_004424 [Cannabis sativa]|uniref:Uncharacterized protein n=1 Tax=Cannabis sativa TaxID=3483 RepID=A0A7J6I1F9_CANSA|nr:hypothetical protein G4B88_004424 [Cannabis sativa]
MSLGHGIRKVTWPCTKLASHLTMHYASHLAMHHTSHSAMHKVCKSLSHPPCNSLGHAPSLKVTWPSTMQATRPCTKLEIHLTMHQASKHSQVGGTCGTCWHTELSSQPKRAYRQTSSKLKLEEEYKNIEMGLKKYASERKWRSFDLVATAYGIGSSDQVYSDKSSRRTWSKFEEDALLNVLEEVLVKGGRRKRSRSDDDGMKEIASTFKTMFEHSIEQMRLMVQGTTNDKELAKELKSMGLSVDDQLDVLTYMLRKPEYVATFKSIDGEIREAFVTRVLREVRSSR